MKKTIIAIAILFTANTGIFARTQKLSTEIKPTAAVKYTCPMHKKIVRNKPGKCPICGITLVRMKRK